jgi:hypothetical protein
VDDSFREWITTEQFDIYVAPEVGLYWPKVPAKLQLRERLREWWEPGTSHPVDASNKHAISNRIQRRARQWGGVMQLSKEHAAARVIESGRDPLGLGRWVWTLYPPGKDNRLLWVITAYRPCYKGTKGLENVHAQHRNYYNTHFPQQNKLQCAPNKAHLVQYYKVV